jgi:hypothetical protein
MARDLPMAHASELNAVAVSPATNSWCGMRYEDLRF